MLYHYAIYAKPPAQVYVCYVQYGMFCLCRNYVMLCYVIYSFDMLALYCTRILRYQLLCCILVAFMVWYLLTSCHCLFLIATFWQFTFSSVTVPLVF